MSRDYYMYKEFFLDENGKIHMSAPLGIDGNPVTRTKREYPYSYDPFIIKGNFGEEATGGVYSDRILQWDYKKHNKLCQEIFGNEGQSWSGRSMIEIEEFLQKFFDNDKIRLLRVFEGCNAGNGYPYWYFEYKEVQTDD